MSIRICKFSFSITTIIPPLSRINATVFPTYDSLSLSFTFQPFSNVTWVISKLNLSQSHLNLWA
jgi:hypothetical protein